MPFIDVTFTKTAPQKASTVVVFAKEDRKLLPQAAALDKKSSGLITAALALRDGFKGKAGDTMAVFLPATAGYGQALVVGLGKGDSSDTMSFETAGGKAWAALKSLGATSADILHEGTSAPAAAALLCGMALRAYHFDKYKTKGKDKKKTGDGVESKPIAVTLVSSVAASAKKLFDDHKGVIEGVYFARDLVSEPPNVLYPESFAAILQKELKPLGVRVEVLDHIKMEKLGFGAHLAVGMGSARPPRVVIMHWNGGRTTKDKATIPAKGKGPMAFVGKGVTFDTGGISIKPAAGMDEMKMDMGGSAAVVGLIKALAVRKAKVDVVGIIGLAENMPSDRSYRPGDIIQSLAGKTIEVLNTDAEGRLILADALTYIQHTYKPRMIVDLATLTGAIMVALGTEYAGAFVNNDSLWHTLDKAAKTSGEKLWRMPLDEVYRDEMRSTVADLKNLGNAGRYGGACSAAGFLEHFIEDQTPWAHLDIAGMAWGKADKPTVPKGGTGYGVRLLYDFVMIASSKKQA